MNLSPECSQDSECSHIGDNNVCLIGVGCTKCNEDTDCKLAVTSHCNENGICAGKTFL